MVGASPTVDIPAEEEDAGIGSADAEASTESTGSTTGGPTGAGRSAYAPAVHRLRDLDRRDRIVAACLGFLLLLAPLLAFVRLAPDWTPAGDPAVMAFRALDVGTDRTPLIGQSSTASAYVDDDGGEGYQVNHLGPIHYYLMAPALRTLGVANGMLVVSLLINGSALLVAAWAVFRQLGARAGVLAVVILSAVAFTVGSGPLVQPLNSVIAGMPLLCTLVLAWCVLCRDFRLLSLLVGFASFTAQQHLSVVPIVALGLLVGLAGGLVAFGRVGGWSDWTARRGLLRWSAAALLVGLVLWTPPLVQQMRNEPGNLELAWRFAREGEREHLGYDISLRQVVHTVGLPPLLYETDLSGEQLVAPTSPLNVVSALAVGVTVLVLAVRWRRAQPRRSAAALMAATLVVAGLVTGSSLPPGFAVTRVDFFHWVWPLLLFMVLLLGLAAGDLVDWLGRRFRDRIRPGVGAALRPGLLALAAVVVAGPTLLNPSLDRWTNMPESAGAAVGRGPIEELADQVEAHEDELRWPVVVLSRGQYLFDGLDTALAIELQERGFPVHVSAILDRNVHPDRLANHVTAQSGLVLLVEGPYDRPEPRGELIADVDASGGAFDWEAYETLVDQFETVDQIRLPVEVEQRLAEGPVQDQLLLQSIHGISAREFPQALHTPEVLRMLLDQPVVEPEFDRDLVQRVLDTLPDNPRVFRLRLYLLDRRELLNEAGPSELNEPPR